MRRLIYCNVDHAVDLAFFWETSAAPLIFEAGSTSHEGIAAFRGAFIGTLRSMGLTAQQATENTKHTDSAV